MSDALIMMLGDHRKMRSHNSPMGFYTQLIECIYHDVVGALCPQREQQRDLEEIRNRTAHEGLSFLTKTLPRLGKSIDVALGSGTMLQYSGFKKAQNTQLPRFARTLISILFTDDGYPRFASEESETELRANSDQSGTNANNIGANGDIRCSNREVLRRGCTPDHCRETAICALRALREVCFCFYKLETPYTYEQEKTVCDEFRCTDEALQTIDLSKDPLVAHTVQLARGIICRVLANASPLSGLPRHGPGAVATGESPVEKHQFKRYYSRLDAVFKYDEWFFYNHSHLGDSLQNLLSRMESLEYGTAKVVLVPKDSRGPRLISCEPLEYQWIQQSLKDVLVTTIEKHPLTRGHVNFTDQTVNRDLALQGSIPPFRWVTLDMKEASDRVSLALVRALFPDNWYDALYACRTPQTKMPDGTIVRMNKFAPMGSAVCFPVEALVFYALSIAALQVYTNTPLRKAVAKVFVYGDDIICSSGCHAVIGPLLESVGLRLNSQKCCTAGPFKESCGMDAFFGASVTPLRVRRCWSQHRSPDSLVSYVAFHNAAFERGWWRTAEHILQSLQKIWKWSIPIVSERVGSSDPSCVSFVRFDARRFRSLLRCKTRINRDLQRKEVRGYAYRPTTVMSRDCGWELMLRVHCDKSRVNSSDSPTNNALSTGEYPIAHGAKLRRAWTVV